MYWLDVFHIDGLRVDAVASMLYLDYSRKAGEWAPNEHGGRENLDAIHFLQSFNDAVHEHHPETFTIAEESTAWPGVTHPTDAGGLGFDLKWMMGWMHDTLLYFSKDPIYRMHHHGILAFSIYYAFSEHFMLPLSHDEVVYGKGSLINKMPGDEWQKFANLRLLYSYMYGHPGAKMIFMGGEFAQHHEWQHDYSLDWHENSGLHNGVQLLLRDLNLLYQNEPALYARNFSPEGFEWIDYNDSNNCVLSWIRKDGQTGEQLIFIGNFTPVVHRNYRIGVPAKGNWQLILNSDDTQYGGSGVELKNIAEAFPVPMHGRTHSVSLTLPPLALMVFKTAKTKK
jgi:1,4-alpha-glucan branching enzyme